MDKPLSRALVPRAFSVFRAILCPTLLVSPVSQVACARITVIVPLELLKKFHAQVVLYALIQGLETPVTAPFVLLVMIARRELNQ